jgi:hypothetical protein
MQSDFVNFLLEDKDIALLCCGRFALLRDLNCVARLVGRLR